MVPSPPTGPASGRTCTGCAIEWSGAIPPRKGFVVQERRCVVERSFGWLAHWGGLLRDRAGRLDVLATRVAFAATLSSVEALINPMPLRRATR